jgi:hypothetical protein
MSQDPLSQQAWQWLGRELDRWSNAGLRAQFWWRDDDASDSSEALDRLLQLAEERQVPLALAVIPARLQPGLVDSLKNQGLITVLQHGYALQATESRANSGSAGKRWRWNSASVSLRPWFRPGTESTARRSKPCRSLASAGYRP